MGTAEAAITLSEHLRERYTGMVTCGVGQIGGVPTLHVYWGNRGKLPAMDEWEGYPVVFRRTGKILPTATTLILLALAASASGAEPSVAEKPLPALQAETARSLEELKASAAEQAKLATLPPDASSLQRSRERHESIRRNAVMATSGMWTVAAPRGNYFAADLARQCDDAFPDVPVDVFVNVRFSDEPVCQVSRYWTADSHRVWVHGRDREQVRLLVERAIDALAGRPQRTLEPESGRGVPQH